MNEVAVIFFGRFGESLTTGPVPVRFEAMAEYTRSVSEPGYERNIHTDTAIARQYGLDQPIAEGRMWITLLSVMLGNAFGRAWMSSGSFNVTFTQMVKPGDEITARGVVTESQPVPDGRRVQLDVWCENQRGEKVAAGTASCTLHT